MLPEEQVNKCLFMYDGSVIGIDYQFIIGKKCIYKFYNVMVEFAYSIVHTLPFTGTMKIQYESNEDKL